MLDILLTTYNSSHFLEETIESILRQTFTGWRLLIRDGGSEDHTQEIILKFQERYPDKIVFSPAAERLSACENFSALLRDSTALYVMFCDHDDVWLPDKISKSLSRMKKLEESVGSRCPILLFSDNRVVSGDLSEISPSFFRYQGVDPGRITLNHLLVQNVPSGCTILMNRPLAELCTPIPAGAVMHDHWCSLCAAAFGKILYLDEPTLLYRQHSRNLIGARPYGWHYCVEKIQSGKVVIRDRFCRNIEQARVFLDQFRQRLNQQQIRILEDFSSLRERNWLQRRKILLRHKLFKSGWIRNVGMFLIV